MVPRILCKDGDLLTQCISGILENGGEGVIMRKVGSLYEHGRSAAVVKLKVNKKKLVGRGGEKKERGEGEKEERDTSMFIFQLSFRPVFTNYYLKE